MKLTKKQQKLVYRLQKLADAWDKRLYLFVGDGSLHIIRKNKDGTIPMTPSGGVDQDATARRVVNYMGTGALGQCNLN